MAPYTMKSTEVSTVPRYIEEPIGRLDKAGKILFVDIVARP